MGVICQIGVLNQPISQILCAVPYSKHEVHLRFLMIAFGCENRTSVPKGIGYIVVCEVCTPKLRSPEDNSCNLKSHDQGGASLQNPTDSLLCESLWLLEGKKTC
jgi:hypothetical protein